MALRVASPISNSLGMETGHTSAQSPQAVHSFSSTNLAFFRTLTWKFPIYPETSLTSLLVSSVILGCLPASLIFGARIQMEQSIVGKVLSICAILPPMLGSFSTRVTL